MGHKCALKAGAGVFESPCDICPNIIRSDKSQMYADKALKVHKSKYHGIIGKNTKKHQLAAETRIPDERVPSNSLLAYCRSRAQSTTNYSKVLDIWINSR